MVGWFCSCGFGRVIGWESGLKFVVGSYIVFYGLVEGCFLGKGLGYFEGRLIFGGRVNEYNNDA